MTELKTTDLLRVLGGGNLEACRSARKRMDAAYRDASWNHPERGGVTGAIANSLANTNISDAIRAHNGVCDDESLDQLNREQ